MVNYIVFTAAANYLREDSNIHVYESGHMIEFIMI